MGGCCSTTTTCGKEPQEDPLLRYAFDEEKNNTARKSPLDIENEQKQHIFALTLNTLPIQVNSDDPYYLDSNRNNDEPDIGYAILYESTLDYSNPLVADTQSRLGEMKINDLSIYSQDDLGFLEINCTILKPYVQQLYRFKQLKNGVIYDGAWNRGQQQGFGKSLGLDGSIYQGFWKNGKCHGYGRIIHSNGDAYQGEWTDDRSNGYGTYWHCDDVKYEGEWSDDIQHGFGKESWPDGSHYAGDYKRGLKDGRGTFIWNDNAKYIGDFQENVIQGIFEYLSFSGEGEYIWADGRRYKGQWQNDKMYGVGELSWPDGRIYKGSSNMNPLGSFFNDKKDGYGEYFWVDGKNYKGQWKDGKQEGEGTLSDQLDQNQIKGIWHQAKLIRRLND